MSSVAAAVAAALAAAKAEKGIIVDQLAVGLITTAFAAPRLYHASMRTGMEPVAVNVPPSWRWGAKGRYSELRCQDRADEVRAGLDIKLALTTNAMSWDDEVRKDRCVSTHPHTPSEFRPGSRSHPPLSLALLLPAAIPSDPQVELVFCGPPPWHTKNAVLECLRYGKHVFCNPALGLNLDEAVEIYQGAQECHSKVHNSRHARWGSRW
jgi:hypothetical protein